MSLEQYMIPQTPKQLELKKRLILVHEKVSQIQSEEYNSLIDYLRIFAGLGLKSICHQATGTELPQIEIDKVKLELSYKELKFPTEKTLDKISNRIKEIGKIRNRYQSKLDQIQEHNQVSGLSVQPYSFIHGGYTLAPGWNYGSLSLIQSDLNILDYWKTHLVDLWIDSIGNHKIYLWNNDNDNHYIPVSLTEFRAYVAIAKWAEPYIYCDEFATISIGKTTDMESLRSVMTFSAIPQTMSVCDLPI